MSAVPMNWVDKLPRLPRPVRLAFVTGVHLIFFTAAYLSAFLVRFDFHIPTNFREPMWEGLAALLLVKMTVFALFKMFQGWWKYVSLYDVIALAQALALATLAFLLVNTFLIEPVMYPRSIYLLDFLLALMFIGGARGSLRIMREATVHRASRTKKSVNIIIVGAGDTGETLVREINKNRNLAYRPLAFLDDDTYKHGLRIHGVPVLGKISDLPELAEKYGVEQIIIAMPSASREQIRCVIETARQARIETRILPAVEAILDGNVSINHLREVSINDLLGREPVKLDTYAIGRFIEGATVLVTGAGGSIGAELCRQVLRFNPKHVVMVDCAETPLFFINRELGGLYDDRVTPFVANVTDLERMRIIFAAHRPDVVIHAAAYKHVPMMEQNPCEAVKNNVGGTQNVADLAAEFKAKTFVLISTDKAVNPTSIMGATKRVTELYVRHLNASHPDTKFCAVRFGNVLGSNGSVIPIFRDQIQRGGPVTVTHPEMTRYFMTIPEAVQLVLQAASFNSPSELFILDMGEPVKIADLARDMIRLSGLSETEIPIVFSGIRPGEKLFEELALSEECVDRTDHKKIFTGKNGDFDFQELRPIYLTLLAAAHASQEIEVRRQLKTLIPTYTHPDIPENVVSIGTGKHRAVLTV
ncbi:MAG: polysaccharide biosynthesis protein [Bradymonadaceae bacterium]|nr:polysaccharide biosynthesis protein [Lujinxingiaceae bacterium]